MAMTSRAKKRLALALVVVVLGGGALPGAYLLRRSQKAQSIESALEEGLGAYNDGDHTTAVKRLRYYVSSKRFNDEANLALARSLMVAAGENETFLLQAIDHALRVRETDHLLEAREMVLDAYARAGRLSESLQAADQVLSIDSAHYNALSARAAVLVSLRRWDDALEAARILREEYPGDLDAQSMWFHTVMSLPANRRPSERELRAQMEQVYQDHADDVRFGLLRFDFLLQLNLVDESVTALHESLRGARLDSLSPTQLRHWSIPIHRIANLARENNLRELARAARARFLDLALASPDLARHAELERAIGAWMDGRPADAFSAFESAASPADTASTEALGWAMLIGIDDPSIEAELERRASAEARYWLELAHASALIDAGEFREAETVLGALSDNAGLRWLVHFVRGQARMRLGDPLAAADAFERSIVESPRGPAYVAAGRLGEALFDAGMYRRSLEVTTDAVALAGDGRVSEMLPKSVGILAGAGLLSREFSQEIIDSLSSNLNQDDASIRGMPHVVSMYIALNREDLAKQIAARTIDRAEEADAGTLAEIARLMMTVDAGIAQDLLDLAMTKDTEHPSVLLAQATHAAVDGSVPEGLAILDQALTTASEPTLANLDAARDRYLARFLPDVFEAEVIERANAATANAQAQLAALSTSALWTDQAACRAVIDRLQTILGEDGLAWRPHEARWILSFAPDQSSRVRTDVLAPLLTRQSPDPRVLLLAAEGAMREAQNPELSSQAARLRLNEAANLYERTSASAQVLPAITLRSIRNLQQLGRFEEADARLRALATDATFSYAERAEVATLFERRGLFAEAAEALAAIAGPDRNPTLQGQIARLWSRAGRMSRARDAYARAVSDPSASWTIVVDAAAFHDAIGEPARSQALLASLEQRLPPDDAALARAEFLSRIGKPADAERILSELAPKAPRFATRLAEFHARNGRNEAFDNTLQDALTRFPDDPALIDLRNQREQLALGLKSDMSPDAAAVAELLQEHEREPIPPAQLVAELRAILARYPTSAHASVQLVRVLRADGRLSEALSEARQLVSRAAADPAATQLAAVVAIEAGDLPSALVFAREWRRRSTPRTAPADRLIAGLQLDLAQAQDALPWASANRERAEAIALNAGPPDTGEAPPEIAQVVQILVATDRLAESQAILDRLVAADPGWAIVSLDWIPASRASPEARRAWIAWAERSFEPSPEDAKVLARHWYAAAAQSSASEDFRRVVELLSTFSENELDAPDCARLAASYSNLGELHAAARWYDSSIAKSSGEPDPLILNNAVYVDYQLGQLDDQSLARIETAIALLAKLPHDNGTMVSLLDTKGLVELGLDRPADALASYQRAFDLPLSEPKADLWVGQAQALLALGRTEEARATLNALPVNVIRPQLQARIEKIREQF